MSKGRKLARFLPRARLILDVALGGGGGGRLGGGWAGVLFGCGGGLLIFSGVQRFLDIG